MSYENFPYTNIHELNLDWILAQLKMIKESAVMSVNGETGEVILYKDKDIVFPEVDDPEWSMMRTANGTPIGVIFQNGVMYVKSGNSVSQVYTGDNPPAYPVISVNGQTGAVTLYQDHNTRLPDVSDTDWNIHRVVDKDGTPTSQGIQFAEGQPAKRIDGTNRYQIYDASNQPPYPVTSVNGATGAVTTYPNAITQLPNVPETAWNIFRSVDTGNTPTEEGIEFTKGAAMKRIDGTNRYSVYDAGNPPPYPVTSVNGQTGQVVIAIPVTSVNGQTGAVSIPLPFADNTASIWAANNNSATVRAGLQRGVSNGTVTLELNTTGDTIKAYLKFVSTDQSVNESFQLLTTNEIPAGSGVLSINGMAGVVYLYGTDIQISSGINQNVKVYVDNQFAVAAGLVASEFDDTFDYFPGSFCIHNNHLYRATDYVTAGAWDGTDWALTDVANALYYKADQEGLAWVEDELQAQHNIPAGHLVLFSGVMCRATANISVSDNLVIGTNLALTDAAGDAYSGKGALNSLVDQIATLNSNLTNIIMVQQVTFSNQTIAAGSSYEFSKPITTPPGYSYLMGIMSETGDSLFSGVFVRKDSANIYAKVTNFGSSSGLGAPKINIYWIRSDSVGTVS